jgi:DNA-binding MarR family transcriptional regulator
MQPCLFCDGDASAPDHWMHCDGRQGRAEETYDAWARTTDPETSHVAAEAVNASALETKVIRALTQQPYTTEEIANRLGLWRDTVSPRMRSLERKGLVERIGKRRNASGLHAIVWALTALGRIKVAS